MSDSQIFGCHQTDKILISKLSRECLIPAFLSKNVGHEKVVLN